MKVLDSTIRVVTDATGWLVLPVSLLLFLQWPLRDLLHRWSVQANDLAQWLFALYIATALTVALRTRTHLAIDGMAGRLSPGVRQVLYRLGMAVCLLPWTLLVILAGAPAAWRSLLGWEAFAETSDPGYFMIKLSAVLLAVLLGAQVLVNLVRSNKG